MVEKFIHTIFQERYQIQSLLGRQTGRRTFLARDLQTQSSVVVKLLLFNPDFTWDDLKLFEREAETLKNIDHPAIPQYLDYFEVETELGKGSALVQSYIEAKSLQDWAESGRSFSEVELKAIATQLLKVLQYLHSRQPPIIHRDIKPSNILLTDRSGNSLGVVYLVDFGSVQTVVQNGTITIVGTYGYMPPEQFGGRTTPASDLYSLGATLIYLITGKHPADLPTRRGQIQFEANYQISKLRFQAWIKSLTQPDIEQRLNTAQQALEILQNDSIVLDIFPKTKSKIHRKCDVYTCKNRDAIEVSAPAQRHYLSLIFLMALMIVAASLLVYFLVVFIASGEAGYLVIAFSFLCILLPIILTYLSSAAITRTRQEDKIILRLDQNTAFLYRQSQPKTYFKQTYTKNIINVEVVCGSPQLYNSTCYHVELKTDLRDRLLVGNRKFWLSQQEAYWIADELSQWLKVPITQKQVH